MDKIIEERFKQLGFNIDLDKIGKIAHVNVINNRCYGPLYGDTYIEIALPNVFNLETEMYELGINEFSNFLFTAYKKESEADLNHFRFLTEYDGKRGNFSCDKILTLHFEEVLSEEKTIEKMTGMLNKIIKFFSKNDEKNPIIKNKILLETIKNYSLLLCTFFELKLFTYSFKKEYYDIWN